jgi:hypothetical protein
MIRYSVAIFAVPFVRSYPGGRPVFSRAGDFGLSARFYRRSGPAPFSVRPARRAGAFSVGPALRTGASREGPALFSRPGTAHEPVHYCAGFNPQCAAIKEQSIRVLGTGVVDSRPSLVVSGDYK